MTWKMVTNVNAKLVILVNNANHMMINAFQIHVKTKLHVILESEMWLSVLVWPDGLEKNAKSEVQAVSQ